MLESHREVLVVRSEEVTVRVPKELLGQRVEVVVTAIDSGEAGELAQDLTPHASWTPELLALLDRVAGSMPGLKRPKQSGNPSYAEREWPQME